METPKHPQLHYAWVIFIVCFLSVFTALGFCSSPKSLYLAAITENLGIPRSLFSIGDSFRFLTTAIMNLFFGKLLARFGARTLMTAGFCSLILSALLGAAANAIWSFYLNNLFLGLGLAWTTTTLVGVVVERWFAGRKGTIMGFILAANGLGGAISSQLLSQRINAAPDGWRKAYLLAAAILTAVALLVVLFMRNAPEDLGLSPLGDGTAAKKKQRGSEWLGIDSRTAFRRPYFYFCAASVFLTGMILQSLVGIVSAHMKDRGIDAAVITNALSIASLCLTGAKMLSGFCFDRFGLRITMTACSLCAIASILLLMFLSGSAMAVASVVLLYAALPLETIMLPLIAKECFGQRSYASLMGLLVSCSTLGYSLGSPLMNLIFDLTGTYNSGLVTMAILMTAVAILTQLVITAAHRERKRVEQAA